MAKKRRKPKRKPDPKRVNLPPGFFAREPKNTGAYVLKSIIIPFTGKVKRLWLSGDYAGVWQEIRERVYSEIIIDALSAKDDTLLQQATEGNIQLQSVRLVINGRLQKRSLKAEVADFEQYMFQLVRISPTVTDGISGFSLRVVYKQTISKNEQSSKRGKNQTSNGGTARGDKKRRKLAPKQRRTSDGRFAAKPRRDAKGRFTSKKKRKPKGGRR